MRGWRGKHADILSRCLLLQACCLGFGCFAVMTCHSFSFFFANKNGDEVRQFGEVFFLVLILQEVRRRYCWFFVEQLLYISAGFFFPVSFKYSFNGARTHAKLLIKRW